MERKNGKGVAKSDLEKAEEFNGQFTDEHTQVPLLDRSAPFMDDIVVSKDGVIKLLKSLNPSKALGPDELHPRVLKELATELGPVFAHLCQQSTDSGIIPKEWSLANVYPFSRRVTGHLRAIIARFPWRVYLATFSNTYRRMGYFRVAKFSRFCLKKHGDYILWILIFAVGNDREK